MPEYTDGLPETAPKKVNGRPRADIDLSIVERAAAIGCSVPEIAALLGIGETTLNDRMRNDAETREAVERGRSGGKVTLRRAQWHLAVDEGNGPMQIWLGKQMLGQRDHKELTGAGGGPIDFRNLETDQLAALLAHQAAGEDDPADTGGTGPEEAGGVERI